MEKKVKAESDDEGEEEEEEEGGDSEADLTGARSV